jgi:hypothetical protein
LPRLIALARQAFLLRFEAAFHFPAAFGSGERLWHDAAVDEQGADLLVVLDLLIGDARFRAQIIDFRVEVGDLVREVLGLDRNRREEVGQRAAFRDCFFMSCVVRPPKSAWSPLRRMRAKLSLLRSRSKTMPESSASERVSFFLALTRSQAAAPACAAGAW